MPLISDDSYRLRVDAADSEQQLGRLRLGFTELNSAAELASKGVQLVGQGLEALAEGAQLNDIAGAFERMGGSAQSLDRMSAALGGAVSDAQIRRFSNMANTLGINAEQFERLLPAARGAAQALGLDVTQALESVTTGVARGSRQWLDNLGIVVDVEAINKRLAATLGVTVDKLTAAQETQAFVNEVAGKAGPIASSQGEAVARMGAAWDNAKDALQRFLAEQIVGSGSMTAFVERDLRSFNAGVVQMTETAFAEVRRIRAFISSQSELQGGLAGLRGIGATVAGGADAIDTAFRRALAKRGVEIDREREKQAAAEAASQARVGAELHRQRVVAQTAILADIEAQEGLSDTRRIEASLARDAAGDRLRILAAERRHAIELQITQRAGEDAIRAALIQLEAVERVGVEAAARAQERLGRGGLLGVLIGGIGGDQASSGAFVDELVRMTDASEIAAGTVTAAFSGMAASLGQSIAQSIIYGDQFGKSLRKGTAAVLEGIATQAFAQAGYLAAIAPVAFLLGPLGPGSAAVALSGAAALTAVGLTTAGIARGLGGSREPQRAAAGAPAVGGGTPVGPAPTAGAGTTTIVVNVGIGQEAVTRAVVDQSRSSSRGRVQVVTR